MDYQLSRINDVLYEIHRDIAAELSARKLAALAHYSEQHFHRVFKVHMGESLHAYIRRIRLEQAANQLTFDAGGKVCDVAVKCGFQSLASFTHAFKQQFGVTPGVWRKREPQSRAPAWQASKEISEAYKRIAAQPCPVATLCEREPVKVAYVRHKGYGRGIRVAWQRLQAWARSEGRSFSRQIGLHHSNPERVPLDDCRYVACMAIDKPILRRTLVNTLTLPGGLHASFYLQGRYGELLPWISKILCEWLPASGFKLQTTPGFVEYEKNHFLSADETFELYFYLPISLV